MKLRMKITGGELQETNSIQRTQGQAGDIGKGADGGFNMLGMVDFEGLKVADLCGVDVWLEGCRGERGRLLFLIAIGPFGKLIEHQICRGEKSQYKTICCDFERFFEHDTSCSKM